MKPLLNKLLDGVDLTEAEARSLVDALADPKVSEVVKSAALAALRVKGETGTEIRGMALRMREMAVEVRPSPHGPPLIDTAGTGGDGSNSFNISTAASIVLAASGLRVVKHGNRSISSACGSADVLEALGVGLAEGPEDALAQLVDAGFCFLFAPKFHPATGAIVALRRAMGVRTVFNILGPLTNPARPPFQLVGVYDASMAERMADALSGMPIDRAFVVHGALGWDEATPCGPFLRFDVRPGRVERVEVDPMFTYGIPRCAPEALAGGDAAHNARLMSDLFSGVRGAIRDAVLLNAALGLELTGACSEPREALARAAETLDSGRATWYLERLRAVRS